MAKMADLHIEITDRIDAAPTLAALALLRLNLTQSKRITPAFDEQITLRMAFLRAEASVG